MRINRPAAACLLLCLPPLGGCVARAPAPVAAPPPPPVAASSVLPGGGAAAGDAWYDDRRGTGAGVVAGPAVAQESASVTRTRGGLSVTANGDVRDTLDRRTTRSTVRTER